MPLLIVIAIFPVNWVAALILLGTAPLIPLFMAMVGMGRLMPTAATSRWAG